jgi:general secretion pathway protein M
MNAQLMTWWRERSVREQRLLLVMAALAMVTFLWLGLYRPVQNALSASHERHQQAVIRLGEVRAQADALRALQHGGVVAPTGPLLAVVTRSAGEAGFGNATVAPQGERRVTVSISSARPAAVFGWIALLEARGIVVEQFSARANSDPTLAIDMTLTGGG